jgi:hypothetical protein
METKIAGCPLGAKCEEVKTDQTGQQYIARCPWYIKIKGFDPNTGSELDHWNCAIAWMPTLLINAANEARQGAAATESFRNEMVKQGEQTQKVMLLAAQISSRKNETLLQNAEICE